MSYGMRRQSIINKDLNDVDVKMILFIALNIYHIADYWRKRLFISL